MRFTARAMLLFAGALLLVYPLWGLLSPESYFTEELSQHYIYAEGVSLSQIRHSAAMLWLSNGIIALALIQLASFVSNPQMLLPARIAGIALIVYPVARTVVETWVSLILTSHASGIEVPLQFSSEKLFFVVFGVAVLGVAAAISELERSGNLGA